jgi:septal ring factor EnvC (AmiA/AmiB activator)
MTPEGFLCLTLDALKRPRKEEPDVERQVLFAEFALKDKQRDVEALQARIDAMQQTQQLLAPQLQELADARKRIALLEQHLFDSTKANQALEARLASQAAAMSAHFSTHMTAARDAALEELDKRAKQLFALLPPKDNVAEMVECIDAMRLAIVIKLH